MSLIEIQGDVEITAVRQNHRRARVVVDCFGTGDTCGTEDGRPGKRGQRDASKLSPQDSDEGARLTSQLNLIGFQGQLWFSSVAPTRRVTDGATVVVDGIKPGFLAPSESAWCPKIFVTA